MLIRRKKWTIAAATLTLVFLSAFVTSEDDAKRKIHVADFNSSQIIGRLGTSLGKVVVIEGTVIEDDVPRKGRDGTKIFRIDTLDDRHLEKAVEFWDEDIVRAGKRQIGLRDGWYRLAVYETGRFEGWPKGDVYRPTPQSRGFHFRSELVIVHNLADGTKGRQR